VVNCRLLSCLFKTAKRAKWLKQQKEWDLKDRVFVYSMQTKTRKGPACVKCSSIEIQEKRKKLISRSMHYGGFNRGQHLLVVKESLTLCIHLWKMSVTVIDRYSLE
jgi:hypothetical protein